MNIEKDYEMNKISNPDLWNILVIQFCKKLIQSDRACDNIFAKLRVNQKP